MQVVRREIHNESQSFSKENLREVQGHQTQRSRRDYLREPEAQATSGLNANFRVTIKMAMPGKFLEDKWLE